MKILGSCILLIVWLLWSGMSATADTSAELLEKADAEYAQREGTGQTARRSLDFCDQVLKSEPQSFEALIGAARACFWICDRSADDAVKKEFGWKGKTYAEQAMKLQPTRVEGYYFYTINLGEYSQGISVVKAVMKGIDKDFREHCTKAIELDASYEHAGPLRAMGRLYFKLPWPKYDAKKSEDFLLKALDNSPGKVRTRYYLAELYQEEKRYPDAVRQLDELLKTEPLQDDVYENGAYKEQAARLMTELQQQIARKKH